MCQTPTSQWASSSGLAALAAVENTESRQDVVLIADDPLCPTARRDPPHRHLSSAGYHLAGRRPRAYLTRFAGITLPLALVPVVDSV
ncbi:hypothetical protein GTY54_48160 [Streptomyces sp. SID625]|nr:hypothetical protein [Streptomyces sp. SID625]